jgi:hypothetical protein
MDINLGVRQTHTHTQTHTYTHFWGRVSLCNSSWPCCNYRCVPPHLASKIFWKSYCNLNSVLNTLKTYWNYSSKNTINLYRLFSFNTLQLSFSLPSLHFHYLYLSQIHHSSFRVRFICHFLEKFSKLPCYPFTLWLFAPTVPAHLAVSGACSFWLTRPNCDHLFLIPYSVTTHW